MSEKIVHKAVIQRIISLTTEYLKVDAFYQAEREWTKERNEAWEFETHGKADQRAEQIREQTGEHVYAAICEKPMAHKPVLDPFQEPKIPKKIDPKRYGEIKRDPVETE